MGVPGFFSHLLRTYKKKGFVFNKEQLKKLNSKSKLLNDINKIDYLLIDANCLIHPVCFKVVADNPNMHNTNSLENIMYTEIIKYIEKLISYADPKKGIFIAIDGAAPMAKVKQQRMRRFKSLADKELWNSIKLKHKKEVSSSWNNSAVTPGTDFMLTLHNKLLSWLSDSNSILEGKEIIYSSCFTPAEGEHKLLQFIRNNEKDSLKKDLSYVIYGLDADLIFLALATNTDDIYLLRESTQIKKTDDESLSYVSISIMRESIVDTVSEELKKKVLSFNDDNDNEENLNDINDSKCINYDKLKLINFDKELDNKTIINDFIFMCYLLGNDFLPHIPSLDIQNNGIGYLIDNYAKTMTSLILKENKIVYLLNVIKEKIQVNVEFLQSFMNNLAQDEDKNLKDSYIMNNGSKKRKFYCDSPDEYDKEISKIENLQFKIADPIKLGFDSREEWRKRYYKHYWNVSEENLEEFSNKMVEEYLLGIKWIALYYFNDCPSWTWHFPYDHPPFISDIANYLNDPKNKNKINNFNFILGKPLKPLVQLLAVLPPQSSFLLPQFLRKLVLNPKSSIQYMYPSKFEQDFINKHKHWMGIPIIPPLDIKKIKHSYEKYKDEMLDEDSKKNVLEENYLFKK